MTAQAGGIWVERGWKAAEGVRLTDDLVLGKILGSGFQVGSPATPSLTVHCAKRFMRLSLPMASPPFSARCLSRGRGHSMITKQSHGGSSVRVLLAKPCRLGRGLDPSRGGGCWGTLGHFSRCAHSRSRQRAAWGEAVCCDG